MLPKRFDLEPKAAWAACMDVAKRGAVRIYARAEKPFDIKVLDRRGYEQARAGAGHKYWGAIDHQGVFQKVFAPIKTDRYYLVIINRAEGPQEIALDAEVLESAPEHTPIVSGF